MEWGNAITWTRPSTPSRRSPGALSLHRRTGCVTWDGENLHRVAAKSVEAVNTNGAGDMFAGAFLYALSRGESDLRATEFATLAAGEVVKYFGPRLDREPLS